jgi:hypothetical protein
VTVADLRVLLAEAWRCMAPADLAERKKPKPLKSSKR